MGLGKFIKEEILCVENRKEMVKMDEEPAKVVEEKEEEPQAPKEQKPSLQEEDEEEQEEIIETQNLRVNSLKPLEKIARIFGLNEKESEEFENLHVEKTHEWFSRSIQLYNVLQRRRKDDLKQLQNINDSEEPRVLIQELKEMLIFIEEVLSRDPRDPEFIKLMARKATYKENARLIREKLDDYERCDNDIKGLMVAMINISGHYINYLYEEAKEKEKYEKTLLKVEKVIDEGNGAEE